MILNIEVYTKLPNEERREYLLDNLKIESISSLAKKMETYTNRIRREAIKLEVPIKDKSTIRKMLLDNNLVQHPTKGKKRSIEEKIKIGETKKKSWTEEAKKNISKKSKEKWEKMNKTESKELKEKRVTGLRNTLVFGSKMEKIIYNYLIDEGYSVDRHRKFLIENEKMSLDMYLNDYNLAIEIDGPSHQLPIWGNEKLLKTQEIDSRKDGLLLGNNIRIIRIKFNKKVYLTDQEYIKKELKKAIHNNEKYQIIKVNI